MQKQLSDLTAALGGHIAGQDITVSRIAPLHAAQADSISFVAHAKHLPEALASQAGALIVHGKLADKLPGRNLIVCDNPQLYFAQTARLFHPAPLPKPGIHPSAVVEASAVVPASCEIGANAYIGERTVLGEGCRILANCVVEADCVLGRQVVLHPNVTVYAGCSLGDRVEIHSGTVIGADGFGNAWAQDHWYKIPQVGSVTIGNDVEIGANTTIDRGAIESTVIAEGAKIDNLVQIAHNVHIGAHTAIAACVGIAGSTHIGAYCQIGGAAMFVGHIKVADKTFIGGGTLVAASISEPNYYASSYPLQTHRDWVKNAVHLRHLNELHRRVKDLENTVKTLKEQ
ncbi:UDP-3-O-(3-hydroxymyristoyl)glucosamine N-acyltransferase [Eikenella sp. S3360]|uniref:UDP-3-O-acylglucosamine N-acyltransferase n=1 Tax=Eikenella glucosivorans TaxID=2766967 RepID=A0ABS0N999_9NEIS|nr:UDP-3-O-(3-hydroxymyristoyl)glucosamine N-acyltransferase [Eikenella glucosivorans]MBH5328873.1 UDP-3-O-(3-hydroxymyristoyl)glucosamine N-acyltransferase [Eikenella glucosivorans]